VVNIALIKETAVLIVNSDPEGATVIFEDDSLGVTPLEKKGLEPIEEGTLILRKEGYEPLAQRIPLFANKPNTYNYYLKRQSGKVEFTANVPGVFILLDGDTLGIYVGNALVKDKVSPGSHSTKGSMKGYYDKEVKFNLAVNEVKKVLIELKAKYGAIDVISVPEGANIFLQGLDTGKKTYSRLTNIEPGEYALRVSLEGYQDENRNVRVYPEKTEFVNIILNKMEYKAKEKSPWKWVYIGGGVAVVAAAGVVYFSIEGDKKGSGQGSVTYTIPVNP
jgi:hypothetical protein